MVDKEDKEDIEDTEYRYRSIRVQIISFIIYMVPYYYSHYYHSSKPSIVKISP